MNKLLARQLRGTFGKDSEISPELQKFSAIVNQSYNHFERDRKLLERAMEISSEEMKEMNRKLREMQIELEQKNKDLDEFVSVASHDLKAPIRTIKSFAQLLTRELNKGENLEVAKEYLAFITDSATGMNELLLSLLDYAKVSRNTSIVTEVDLNQTICAVEKNLHFLIQENDATLEYRELPTISAIPHHMIQLFQNLVGNAMKFKKKSVAPIINIDYSEDKNSFIFAIKDNGIGISEEGKTKVFKAFKRMETEEKYEGVGLGLSICKSIVEKMGGKIWVESCLGVGTTFLFSVPKVEVNAENNLQKVVIADENF